MKYGYARVSSDTQDYRAQVDALKAAGCERIFSEKASGKSTNGRPEFGKLLKALLPGDAVVVCKLDRLARSSRDLHNIIGELRLRQSRRHLVRHHKRRWPARAGHHGRHCRVRARAYPQALPGRH